MRTYMYDVIFSVVSWFDYLRESLKMINFILFFMFVYNSYIGNMT